MHVHLCNVLLIAVLFPGLSFFLRLRILKGILCILLQFTVIGWIPAAIWAVADLLDSRAERRTQRIIRSGRS